MGKMVSGIFGFAVTSPSYVYDRLNKSSTLKNNVGLVTASSDWSRKRVVVVTGLAVLCRHINSISSKQILVISDIASMLSSIDSITPLDYMNKVSYLFTYVPCDIRAVVSCFKKPKSVELKITKVDELGFIVNSLKKEDNTINAFIALTSNLPFDERKQLTDEILTILNSSAPNSSALFSLLNNLIPSSLSNERKQFEELFLNKMVEYNKAFSSKFSSEKAAEKFGVDAYTISFFRKKNNAMRAPNKRLQTINE